MFDARLRPLVDGPLNAAGRRLARLGVRADHVSLFGIALGIGAATAIACSAYPLALVLILANRMADGLDGAVARATRLSDFGGYLDIVGDFIFYVAVPIGFALAAPQNQLAAALLLGAFALTGTSFLAFATIAAKRRLETSAHGVKSFFYSTGLAEGGETIAVFVLMTMLPAWFVPIALTYAGLCALTVLQRSLLARTSFRDPAGPAL
jgi:phosphatidylglycerophosphate synthase